MAVENCAGCERGVLQVPPLPKYPDPEARKAFARINDLGIDLYRQQRRAAKGQSLPSGLPTERVHLGVVKTDDGIKAEVVYGSFTFTQRSLYEVGQPRAYGFTDSWVLAIREAPSLGFRPIAYEADFAELPAALKRPLVRRIKNIQRARQRVQKNGVA